MKSKKLIKKAIHLIRDLNLDPQKAIMVLNIARAINKYPKDIITARLIQKKARKYLLF